MCDVMLLACCGACAFAVFLMVAYLGFGIIFIVVASRAKESVSSHQSFTEQNLSLFPNLCIAIGVLFTVLTVLGWTGEKKGRKMKLIYAAAQMLVIGLGLYIDFGALPNKNKVEKNLIKGFNSSMHMYGLNVTKVSSTNYTADWDNLQENMQCCGGRNYLDWMNVKLENSLPVPISCCREEHRMTGCSKFVPFDNPYEANKYIYAQGCLDSVMTEILGKMEFLYYFLFPIIFITTIGVVNSCCSSGVKKDADMDEKKLGPLIVRTKSKKSKDKELEDMEKGEAQENEDNEQEKLQSEADPKTPKPN